MSTCEVAGLEHILPRFCACFSSYKDAARYSLEMAILNTSMFMLDCYGKCKVFYCGKYIVLYRGLPAR